MTDQLTSDLNALRIDRSRPQRRDARWRSGVLAAVGVVAALGLAAYAMPHLRAQVFKTEVALSEVSTISPAQGSIAITSTGYIEPEVISKVGARLPGRVHRVLVKEGDNVVIGQPLAELDAADQQSAIAASASRVAVAKAHVRSAEANVAEIAQQVAREKVLVDRGAIGHAVLDDLVARQAALGELVRSAQAEVSAASAEGGTLAVGLADRTIRAPISGTVISKPVEAGEVVGPTGFPVLEIADFNTLRAEVDVPEARLHLVKAGGPCEIVLDAYPDQRYRGEVVEIGHRVDRAKATVKVKVRFLGDVTGVLPDMSARVSFLTEALSESALRAAPKKVVPAGAVVERDGHKVIFVVDNEVVHAVAVTVGNASGPNVEVTDGPAAGTRIVLAPPPELADGQKVKEKGT